MPKSTVAEGADYEHLMRTMLRRLDLLERQTIPTETAAAVESVSVRPIFPSLAERDGWVGPASVGTICYVVATDAEYICTAVSPATTWRVWNTPVVGGSYLTWTPSVFDITVGNGSISGQYRISSGECRFTVLLVFGSTTSWPGGAPRVTLPFAWTNVTPAHDDNRILLTGVNATYTDATGGRHYGRGYPTNVNQVGYLAYDSSPVNNSIQGVVPSGSFPFVFAVNDLASLSGRYVPYQP